MRHSCLASIAIGALCLGSIVALPLPGYTPLVGEIVKVAPADTTKPNNNGPGAHVAHPHIALGPGSLPNHVVVAPLSHSTSAQFQPYMPANGVHHTLHGNLHLGHVEAHVDNIQKHNGQTVPPGTVQAIQQSKQRVAAEVAAHHNAADAHTDASKAHKQAADANHQAAVGHNQHAAVLPPTVAVHHKAAAQEHHAASQYHGQQTHAELHQANAHRASANNVAAPSHQNLMQAHQSAQNAHASFHGAVDSFGHAVAANAHLDAAHHATNPGAAHGHRAAAVSHKPTSNHKPEPIQSTINALKSKHGI